MLGADAAAGLEELAQSGADSGAGGGWGSRGGRGSIRRGCGKALEAARRQGAGGADRDAGRSKCPRRWSGARVAAGRPIRYLVPDAVGRADQRSGPFIAEPEGEETGGGVMLRASRYGAWRRSRTAKQAEEIVAIDVRELVSYTDFLVHLHGAKRAAGEGDP